MRAFEARRYASVALNARSVAAAVYAEVGQLSGVIDLVVRQNRGDSPIEIDGVSLAPHSIFVSVVGGENDDIAQAIYSSLSAGCDYNGNTSVVVTDPVTGAPGNGHLYAPHRFAHFRTGNHPAELYHTRQYC